MQPSTPSEDEWRQQWRHTQKEMERTTRSATTAAATPDISVMRSSQVDASHLDDELTLLLREQFLRIFSHFNSVAVGRLQPELTLLLNFLIFRFSIWEGRPLPGMALMNLRFRNEINNNNNNTNNTNTNNNSGVGGPGLSTVQRSLYCFGSVFLRYFWTRAGHTAASLHWGDAPLESWQGATWNVLRKVETGYKIASLLNILVFFKTGKYRSVLERVLRTRLVYARPSAGRAMSYEYLNRQLVWSEVSEVLLFLLPLVNAAAVKKAIHSILPRLPNFPFNSNNSSTGGSTVVVPHDDESAPCGICGTAEILTPYAAEPCNHVFCYYCVRGHTAADPEFQCPTCFEKIEALRPVVRGR